MDEPRFLYQKCDQLEGYVTLMAQFVPTFEPEQPQDGIS